jgi:hypothetical protein
VTDSTTPPADDDPDDLALDLALDELNRWVADAQVDEAIAQRRRTAWLRRQDDEEVTLAGVLTDLGERGNAVVVALTTGRRHRGLIVAVGPDVVEVQPTDGPLVLVALTSVVSVRSHPDDRPARGERPPLATNITMATALSRRAGDRAPVVVVAVNGEVSSGTVLAIGRDVLTLRLASGGVAYLPLSSVSELAVPESG